MIFCGDQGQRLPTAEKMPHDWLRGRADHYEEVLVNHWAKDP
ncbi:MAG: hypothetical protein AB2693_23375 [Candidatus Thiodiazotropha sp.]